MKSPALFWFGIGLIYLFGVPVVYGLNRRFFPAADAYDDWWLAVCWPIVETLLAVFIIVKLTIVRLGKMIAGEDE